MATDGEGFFDPKFFSSNFFNTGEKPERNNALPNLDDELEHKISTTDWIGLAKAVGPQHLENIRKHSKALQVAIMQSDARFDSKTDACKRVEAVIVLLEAPNVPWREVVSLLNHPTVTAFLTAISLIQIIVGLAD
jgi:hypothetical protein